METKGIVEELKVDEVKSELERLKPVYSDKFSLMRAEIGSYFRDRKQMVKLKQFTITGCSVAACALARWAANRYGLGIECIEIPDKPPEGQARIVYGWDLGFGGLHAWTEIPVEDQVLIVSPAAKIDNPFTSFLVFTVNKSELMQSYKDARYGLRLLWEGYRHRLGLAAADQFMRDRARINDVGLPEDPRGSWVERLTHKLEQGFEKL